MKKHLLGALLFFSASAQMCAEATSFPEKNIHTAERFIDAFYSFKSKLLKAALSSAKDSIPSIVYYQGWAKDGNYKIVHRTPCKAEKPDQLSCSITVQDDLMLALGIDFNVTDTFHLSFRKGEISHVATSSNDIQVFSDAQAWVTSNLPELIREPCRDFFNGGPTPGECVQAMVKGYAQYAASEDFPDKPKAP